MNGWNKAALIPILAIFSITGAAGASPLITFNNEPAAEPHFPKDTVVWLDLSTHTYCTKGEFCYGRTNNGAYVWEIEAQNA